jgi:hypothetical protein
LRFQIRDLMADVLPEDGRLLFPCTCRVSADPTPGEHPGPKPPRPHPGPKPGRKAPLCMGSEGPTDNCPQPPEDDPGKRSGLALLKRQLHAALEARP